MHSTEARLLQDDILVIDDRVPEASNEVYWAHLDSAPHISCIYKPQSGERELWDFPRGTLSGREVAAYLVSEALQAGVVPLTVWRDNAPLGPGSLQVRVDSDDAAADAVEIVEDVSAGLLPVVALEDRTGREWLLCHRDDNQLRRIALFDIIINNADRKAGHILSTRRGYVGIDHGVSFHHQPKIRTVLWGWAGDDFTPAEVQWLRTCGAALVTAEDDLRRWLSGEEWSALHLRLQSLVAAGRFPQPSSEWPPLPWPLI